MTGLCRLIRGCAAQTAGPFVRRSERRKLAVLIPLFMSSREKKPSTLQPCPLHPFRGWREEGGSSPVAPPVPSVSQRSWVSRALQQRRGKGLLCGSLNCQLLGNGGKGPRTKGYRLVGIFASADGEQRPHLSPFPKKSGLGQCMPSIPIEKQ